MRAPSCKFYIFISEIKIKDVYTQWELKQNLTTFLESQKSKTFIIDNMIANHTSF